MSIVNAGLERVAQLIINDMSHAAIGTGTTAVAQSDTALETETDRNATTKETRKGAVAEFRTLFLNSELPTKIEEVALLNNSSGGDMLSRRLLEYTKVSTRDMLLVQIYDVREGS